jgi:hypothetical protein
LAGLQQLRLREDIYRGRGLEIKVRPAPVPVLATTPVSVPAPVLNPAPTSDDDNGPNTPATI